MPRRFLLAAAGAMALSGAALAADLGTKAPPPVFYLRPPPPLWTGWYVGVNAGGTWSNNSTVTTAAVPVFAAPTFETHLALSSALATTSVPVNTGRFIGGGQIGYNYQFYNSLVAGFEADIQGVAAFNPRRSIIGAGVPIANESIITTVTASKGFNYFGTIRGRLGFLLTPTLLFYGTGGFAYGGVNSSVSIFQLNVGPTAPFTTFGTSFGNVSTNRVGWTAGGGAEWMVFPNWSLKAEYLYYSLGSATFALSPLTNVFTTGGIVSSLPFASTRFNGHIVRGGINYHFWWGPSPIVTKY